MVLSEFNSIIVPVIIFSVFVLIGNPIIVIILMNLLGYKTRTAFMSGLTVAQISEFSLILVALGYSLGHIDEKVVSLVTLVGVITIAGSTYLILYADIIFNKFRFFISLLEIKKTHKKEATVHGDNPEVIIFGYDRVGYDFVTAAQNISKRCLVVDYNPQSIKRLRNKDIPHRYGDAEDIEFLQEINFHQAKLVISSIPDHKISLLLTKYYRKENTSGIIILTAHNLQEAKELYLAGASYVIVSHYLGAHHAALMIERHGFDVAGFEQERNIHLTKITKRESEAVVQ